ncbi:MAG TPA: iron-containing redox enzyme family protein [Microlunatus sp.]
MPKTSTQPRRALEPSVTIAKPVTTEAVTTEAVTKERHDRSGAIPLPRVHRGDVPIGETARPPRRTTTFDEPVPLPSPRGPVSAALLEVLSGDPLNGAELRLPTWTGEPAEATTDDDLQLALWLAYEQHYRGLAGVDDRWEWHPGLAWALRGWEQQLLDGLRHHTSPGTARCAGGPPPDRAAVQRVLNDLASTDDAPSLSKFLMRDATSHQFGEFLIHRSLYHLKEADPHSWAIPRLSGSVKAAMVTIQADEYGGGATAAMHAQLFRSLLSDWDLHDTYGHYLTRVPGVTLMTTNVISMFGLHRRWRGALVGHLAMFEMTSSVPNARYGRGHRRLGGDDEAALFFDEHVVADAVHDQIALHDLVGGLVEQEALLGEDVIFGARCAAYADAAFARHVFDHWDAGVSSLRPSGLDGGALP